MSARALTGQALAAALRKAVDPAVSEALQRNAERLREALEDVSSGPSPLPEGKVGPEGRVRVHGLSGEFPKPSRAALRASPPDRVGGRLSPSGRGERGGSISGTSRHSLDITLSGENLFAREFGALDATADPVIAPVLSRLKRRPR